MLSLFKVSAVDVFNCCASGCVSGNETRKLRSPRKKRCEVEYIVVFNEDVEDGNGSKSREPTM
jgi:hypothetical protein